MNKAPLWLRWIGISIGALGFIWLPIEDQSLWFATLLSAAVSAWLALRYIYNQTDSPSLKKLSTIGVLSGALVTPMAVILIVFKSGLHSHGFLEFPLSKLVSYLINTIWWSLLGILVSILFYRFGMTKT